MWAVALSGEERTPEQDAAAVLAAGPRAAAEFWSALQGFVDMEEMPTGWEEELLSSHPFIGARVRGVTTILRLNRPDDDPLTP
jgi:Zn-dependent protease with chaperone function